VLLWRMVNAAGWVSKAYRGMRWDDLTATTRDSIGEVGEALLAAAAAQTRQAAASSSGDPLPDVFVIRAPNGKLVANLLNGPPLRFTSIAEAEEMASDLNHQQRGIGQKRFEVELEEPEPVEVAIDG
jgi:hypothetical protein